MIVVDENIHDERILKAIAGWYPGQVISITPKERIPEIPALLQALFRHPDLRAKTGRMGKIIRLSPERIESYGPDWEIHTLLWS